VPEATTFERVSLAVLELAKGMKSVAFYPPGHPALIQVLARIVSLFEAIPLPDAGLEIEVAKSGLFYLGASIAPQKRAVADLARELYLRRGSKVIFLPEMTADETAAFLGALVRDPREIQDMGGIEKVLFRSKVSRIWVNRVDYEGLTEMLKKQGAAEQLSQEEMLPLAASEALSEPADAEPARDTVEAILARIKEEKDPPAYRDHLVALSQALAAEPPERRAELEEKALQIFVGHLAQPPGNSEEIARLARLGIREIATDAMVARYIGRLRNPGGRGRRDAEAVLAAVEERAVRPLLAALAEEEELTARKAILDVLIRIGRPAVPAVVDNLSDSRWFIVRNMITILGALGLPDLAPQVAAVLSHPDLRVKKEAIKALARMPHPASVQALGELCFFPDEGVALTATAALAAKKEPEAVMALYRRVVARRFLYPNYRLAHEAIDSLRAIGTDEALQALEDILAAPCVFETKRFRDLKIHALRSISRMEGDRARDLLERFAASGRRHLRWEAQRLLRKQTA